MIYRHQHQVELVSKVKRIQVRQNLREMGRKTRLLKIPSPLPLQRILGVCTHMINFRELEGAMDAGI